MIRVTNRIAGGNVLQTNRGADIARENFADLFALVGVHLQQTPDALSLARAHVEYAVASLQLSGVNANKCELPDKRISHDLERQRENGSLSSALRVIGCPLSGFVPWVSPTSSGEGR